MNDKDIRIGRIGKEVEKAVDHSLTSDIHLYVSGETLDRMARCHPADYLRLLEKAKEAVAKADFARMDENETRLEYARIHFRDGAFAATVVSFVHEGDPARWYLSSLSAWRAGSIIEKGIACPFRRLAKPARKAKAHPS